VPEVFGPVGGVGAFTTGSFSGPVTASGGINSAGHGAFSTVSPTSGVAFTPNASFDCYVMILLIATTVGTLTVTYGPSTGAENTWLPVITVTAGSAESVGMYVPAGWKVVATDTGTTETLSASIHRI
jgi:hypothetical protein